MGLLLHIFMFYNVFYLLHYFTCFRYNIKKPDKEKIFIITLEVAVCFEHDGPCLFTKKVFDNTEVPQIGCDWTIDFSGNTSFIVNHLYMCDLYWTKKTTMTYFWWLKTVFSYMSFCYWSKLFCEFINSWCNWIEKKNTDNKNSTINTEFTAFASVSKGSKESLFK